jgi:hypothetical protein
MLLHNFISFALSEVSKEEKLLPFHFFFPPSLDK